MNLSGCSNVLSAMELVEKGHSIGTCKSFISSDPRLEQIEACCKRLTNLDSELEELLTIIHHLKKPSMDLRKHRVFLSQQKDQLAKELDEFLQETAARFTCEVSEVHDVIRGLEGVHKACTSSYSAPSTAIMFVNGIWKFLSASELRNIQAALNEFEKRRVELQKEILELESVTKYLRRASSGS